MHVCTHLLDEAIPEGHFGAASPVCSQGWRAGGCAGGIAPAHTSGYSFGSTEGVRIPPLLCSSWRAPEAHSGEFTASLALYCLLQAQRGILSHRGGQHSSLVGQMPSVPTLTRGTLIHDACPSVPALSDSSSYWSLRSY